mgnify:CR=1 FL=1
MGRPRNKDGSGKKPREISATDAEWKAVRREAGKAGLSLSRYLLEPLNSSRTEVSAEITIYQVQTIVDIRDHLILIADRLAERRDFLPHFISLELMGIERRLAGLLREGARK